MRVFLCSILLAATLGSATQARADACARLCMMWIPEPRCTDNGNGAYECDAMARMTCGGYRWFCASKSPIQPPYVEKFTWKQPASFSAPFNTAESAPEGAKPVQLKPVKRGQ
jgi:hypothetical protein